MKGNPMTEDFLKVFYPETQQASWCKTCVKRDNCKIQAEVAFEEHTLDFVRSNHIKVEAECRGYINDSKLRGIKNDLLHDWGLRGRRL